MELVALLGKAAEIFVYIVYGTIGLWCLAILAAISTKTRSWVAPLSIIAAVPTVAIVVLLVVL